MIITLVVQQKMDSKGQVAVLMPFERCEDMYVEALDSVKAKPTYLFFKRLFDIIFSVFALIILALPMLIISILVKCTSKGTVFYHQERLGLNDKKIDVIKFRTMCMDAEKNGYQWSDGDGDPRITPLGRFLRRSRLDEIPQFWCILKGDMSVVGPRPERECFYNEFEQYIHGFRQRLMVKPGLTGLAQVRGGYYLKPEEKILYDVEYIKTKNFWLDLRLVFETVKVIFKREGAK